jgi:hypothetical protein
MMQTKELVDDILQKIGQWELLIKRLQYAEPDSTEDGSIYEVLFQTYRNLKLLAARVDELPEQESTLIRARLIAIFAHYPGGEA